jgi:hydrogenase/urease accessory protein HupE
MGVVASPVSAHSMSAALLRIEALHDGTTLLLLKVPRKENGPTSLAVVLPAGCQDETNRQRGQTQDAFIETWQAWCTNEALHGGTLSVGGLTPVVGELVVLLERREQEAWMGVIRRGAPETRLQPDDDSQAGVERASTERFFGLGVAHILSGPDHLLFVFALLLLIARANRVRPRNSLFATMAWTITAFTVAHSITLAASVLDWVQVPSTPVEVVIPLSVLLLAVELSRPNPAETLTARYPWAIAFVFGLLHGFGFAGALREIGIPRESIGWALFFFNLGVEAGQLGFLGALAFLGWALGRLRPRLGNGLILGLERAAVYAIGGASVFWCLQRAWMI